MTSLHYFKIAHFGELKRSYEPAKFHWPRLLGSNFTRAGGNPPPNVQALKKPSPYRVNNTFAEISAYRHFLLPDYIPRDSQLRKVDDLYLNFTCQSERDLCCWEL